ncbi:MAG: hypothetical protein U9N62_08815, partial [Thermotogota bacterium]|nr:hypothetical protein [Thermotogota bacterium]
EVERGEGRKEQGWKGAGVERGWGGERRGFGVERGEGGEGRGWREAGVERGEGLNFVLNKGMFYERIRIEEIF